MNNHMAKQSIRNCIAMVTTVLCSGFFFPLQAQPILTKVEAEKLRPGQVAELVLRSTGFGEIQKINAVQIGDFDIAILEQKISSDA